MGISAVDMLGPNSTLSQGAGPGELERASGVAADASISPATVFLFVIGILVAVRVLYEMAD